MKNIYTNYNETIKYLNELKYDIINYSESERNQAIINLFQDIKLSDFYTIQDENINNERFNICTKIIEAEDLYFFGKKNEPLHYICNFNDIFQNYDKFNGILNEIIDETIKNCIQKKPMLGDTMNYSVMNNCYFVSKMFENQCKLHNIKCTTEQFYPAFAKLGECYQEGKHCFNIVKFDGNEYIVDLTYKQFFEKRNDILEAIGCIGYPYVNPGIFALMDNERFSVAKEILNNGYIKIDENTLKNYLDSFALAYRNIYYYIDHYKNKLKSTPFITSYTDEDYKRFLYTDDNMTNYEPKKRLTYQKQPSEVILFQK